METARAKNARQTCQHIMTRELECTTITLLTRHRRVHWPGAGFLPFVTSARKGGDCILGCPPKIDERIVVLEL